MSGELQLERPAEEPSNPLRQGRRQRPLFLLLVVLALAGAGGVYVWANMGPLIQSLARQAPDAAADPRDNAAIQDLLATQQKASEEMEALRKAVDGQQEQLKTILDQLATLTAKVDALQRPAAPFQIPPSAAAPAPSPAPIAQAIAKPKKPASPRAPKPAGPISTGGAPLDAPSDGPER